MRRFVSAALLAGLLPASALAQQQPSPQPQPPSDPPAQPAPAPPPTTAPATTPATPTVAPATPTPAATANASPAPARGPSRWSASQLQATVSANWDAFDPNYRLSGESLAAVDLNISLRPRYRLSRAWQLRARWDFNLEFTNSDTTSTVREPRFGDPTLDMWFLGIPALGDFRFAAAAGFLFPVSPESRANTLIVTPRVIGQAAWGVDAFAGEFAVIGQMVYSHPFTQYTTPTIRGDFPYARTSGLDTNLAGSLGPVNNQLSGRTNVRDQLSWTVIVAQTWGKWSPGVAFSMVHQWAYGQTASANASDAPDLNTSGSHVRNLVSFFGWLDYSPNPWLTLELGYFQTRNVLTGNGTYGNPFYDPYQDWRLYLNANIVLDKFYEAIAGSAGGEGGVIRTQNTPRRGPTALF